MKIVNFVWLLLILLCTCNTVDPDIPDGQTSFRDKLPACSVEVIDRAGTYVRLKVKIEHTSNTSLDSIRLYYRTDSSQPEAVIQIPNAGTVWDAVSEVDVAIPDLKPLTSYEFRIYEANQYTGDYTVSGHFTTRNAVWMKIGNMPPDLFGKRIVKAGNRIFLITEYISDEYPYTDPTSKHNEIWEYDPDTSAWEFVSQSPFPGRFQCSYFGLDDQIYIGLGHRRDGSGIWLSSFTEWWCYDLKRDEWIQKKDFHELWMGGRTSFSVGNKGYIIIEYNEVNEYQPMHLYEYNPLDDTWMEKAPFPGLKVSSGSSFVIGHRVFFFTGMHSIYEEGAEYATSEYVSDMWEYDCEKDKWTRRSDFGGGGREQVLGGVSMGNKGFVGGGFSLTNDERKTVTDWWCYISDIDTWIAYPAPPDWPDFAFELNGSMYIGLNYEGIWKFVEE